MASEVSFPAVFHERMQKRLHDWHSFHAAHETPPPTSIRINARKSEEKTLARIPWTSWGYYLDERPSFTFDPLFHGGSYYVQEASSMFLEQALRQTVDLSQPLKVLDLCAAPGGKSTHLLSLISDDSLLVSNETIRSRATILGENIQKWGHANVVVTNNDPEDFSSVEGFFDVIVVDAPCSGEGLFRKDPEAMKEWSEDNVALCAARQKRILNDIWPALKEDGVLIYCTCTYNEKENEENIGRLIQEQGAESLPLKVNDAWGVEEGVKDNIFSYRFFPHRVKGEGFFLSAIRKKDEQHEISVHRKFVFEKPNTKLQERLSTWFANAGQVQLIEHNELIIALPSRYVFEIGLLSKFLKVIQRGTAVATAKHDKMVPEHDFALSLLKNEGAFTSIELTLEDAIRYLKKENINVTGERGFALMKYQGVAIGWANLLGNRVNNLYPAAWRIRNSN